MRKNTGVSARQKHVVIAMNQLVGFSLARHKGLPAAQVVIICHPDEVRKTLTGVDIHDIVLHVAGDSLSVPSDTGIFNAIIAHCTNH